MANIRCPWCDEIVKVKDSKIRYIIEMRCPWCDEIGKVPGNTVIMRHITQL